MIKTRDFDGSRKDKLLFAVTLIFANSLLFSFYFYYSKESPPWYDLISMIGLLFSGVSAAVTKSWFLPKYRLITGRAIVFEGSLVRVVGVLVIISSILLIATEL